MCIYIGNIYSTANLWNHVFIIHFLIWATQLSFLLNFLPQYWHLNGCSPLCVRICLFMFILMVDLGTPSISLPQNFNGHRNLNLPLNESTSIGAELPLTKKMGSTYKIIKKQNLYSNCRCITLLQYGPHINWTFKNRYKLSKANKINIFSIKTNKVSIFCTKMCSSTCIIWISDLLKY